MNTRTGRLTSVGAALLLTACSAAEDVATDAADAARSRAAQEASQLVQGQICAVVRQVGADGQVSKTDLRVLSRALDGADVAGLPAELLEPVRAIVETGEASAQDLVAAREACAT